MCRSSRAGPGSGVALGPSASARVSGPAVAPGPAPEHLVGIPCSQQPSAISCISDLIRCQQARWDPARCISRCRSAPHLVLLEPAEWPSGRAASIDINRCPSCGRRPTCSSTMQTPSCINRYQSMPFLRQKVFGDKPGFPFLKSKAAQCRHAVGPQPTECRQR